MSSDTVKHITKRTTCYECDANCAFDVTINAEGIATKVEGMPDCPRGQMQLDRQYHKDRLLYPLKRTGPKGSGEFERISWAEALSTISAELQQAKQQHGAPQPKQINKNSSIAVTYFRARQPHA